MLLSKDRYRKWSRTLNRKWSRKYLRAIKKRQIAFLIWNKLCSNARQVMHTSKYQICSLYKCSFILIDFGYFRNDHIIMGITIKVGHNGSKWTLRSHKFGLKMKLRIWTFFLFINLMKIRAKIRVLIKFLTPYLKQTAMMT